MPKAYFESGNRRLGKAISAILTLALLALIGSFAYSTWLWVGKNPQIIDAINRPGVGAQIGWNIARLEVAALIVVAMVLAVAFVIGVVMAIIEKIGRRR